VLLNIYETKSLKFEYLPEDFKRLHALACNSFQYSWIIIFIANKAVKSFAFKNKKIKIIDSYKYIKINNAPKLESFSFSLTTSESFIIG
jgi:hypothetical protein